MFPFSSLPAISRRLLDPRTYRPQVLSVLVVLAAGSALTVQDADPPSVASEALAESPWLPASRMQFPPPLPAAQFMWPVAGPISSFMDADHPLGIDVGLAGNAGASVVASAPGVVSFAGGVTCCSYGLHILVEHPGFYTTLYAHLSEVVVSEGQMVRQGQVLGISGDTGYSTSEHLHFELRQAGTHIDPLPFLAPRDAEGAVYVLLVPSFLPE